MDSLVNASYRNIATRPIKFYKLLQKPRRLYTNTSLRKRGMDRNNQNLGTKHECIACFMLWSLYTLSMPVTEGGYVGPEPV